MQRPTFPVPGQRALVTGASSGIGKAFATQLAAMQVNLVLVARSQEKLRALADKLSSDHGIDAEVVAMDLSQESAAHTLFERCEALGLKIDLLINNAGFGSHGPFDAAPAEHEHEQVMLNVTTLVDLSRLFLPAMVAQSSGGIINLSSIAGFQPVPYMAVYGATKAFVLSFSEALWAENRSRGVRVLALCPGPVETEFFNRVGSREIAVGPMGTPDDVAAAALGALAKGNRPTCIPGWRNRIQVVLPRFAPRVVVAWLAERIMRPLKKVAAEEAAQSRPAP